MRKSHGKLTRSISLILASALVPFFTLGTSLQISSAASGPGAFHVNATPGAHEAYVMPYGHLNITYADLKFILDQIKIGEAHAARTATSASTLETAANSPSSTIIYPYDITSATRCLTPDDLLAAANKAGPTSLSDQYPFNVEYPWGVRQVDGQCNNIHGITAESAPTQVYSAPITASDPAGWGAADQIFTRLAPATNKASTPYALNDVQKAYQDAGKSVLDPTPREISNIISDQSAKNPAAVAAATQAASTLANTPTAPDTEFSINAGTGAVSTVLKIPNITPDYNVSAGYNSWFTLFGQFFDHGLDLIPKAGATVLIPLMQDDPLYIASPGAPNFMVLTRGADATTGDSLNTTTPYVDQSQTYGSHPSQNFFLREYKFAAGTGYPTSTGRLIEGTDQKYTTPLPPDWTANPTVGGTLTSANGGTDIGNGGLATWREIKAQARLLGFNLTDYDARSIPVIATDQYGKFIPAKNHFPMMLFTNGSSYVWEAGNPAAPIGTGAKTATDPLGNTSLPNQSGSNWHAVSTGHAFLNDTMASAVPFDMYGAPLAPDADSVMNSPNAMPVTGYYDDEALNAHFISGDGRLNENIGLSAIHHIFHGEHNLVAQDITDLINNDPEVSAAFKSEWTGNGERLYQAARFVNEMEYQHMVYDEFIRRIAPGLPLFSQYDPNLNADIPAEFASAVYRLGHSMLDETIARSNPGSFYDPTNNQDVNLITGFTNPAQARLPRPMILDSASWSGSNITFTMAKGETAPQVGEIVSTSGMAFNVPTNSDSFNINSAVVASRTDTTFTVSTYYPGGSVSGAVALPAAPSLQTSVSTLAPDLSTKVASVAINDPLTNGYAYSPGASAASIAQGMSSQRGNEIDEFITDAVRNNLLGLPLDLASLNLSRGRDVGVPTLNQFRKQYSASLTPYTSWRDFISHLRYPESGVNFVAAYGNHSSLTDPVTIANISGATATAEANSKISISYTYTPATGKQVKAGDVVTITGFGSSNFDVANAIVSSASGSSFVIKSKFSHAASAVLSYPSAGQVYGSATPALLTGATGSISGSAVAKREPNIDEKRLAAAALVSSTMSVSSAYPSLPSVPGDAADFMTSTGSWAGKESGLNDVDLWIGGLAENPAKQPVTPPMLGTTFQFVFENVALKLQNGDRFYYLSRLMGHNLGEEIPAQKFTDIVRRNTPSASATQSLSGAQGIIGMNSPGFSISDCAYSTTSSLVPPTAACSSSSTRLDPNSGALIHDGLENVTGFGDPTTLAGVKITGGAGDDSIFGSVGNDILSGGIGGDLVDGGAGDDIIFGGAGEDILKGGPGNDVINPGDNQFGEVADGGSGDDYIHMGAATGFAISLFGETGNDFIQGSNNLDIFLGGGEGDDWVEGSGDQDNALYGDNGPTFAAQQPTLGPGLFLGGNDVLNGGPGYDTIFGGGGDDIFLAGDGIDTMQGDGGFDWLNYEQDVRFDNGATKRPSVFMDLSGTVVNPIASTTQDQVVDMEGLSGSAGNDVLAGRNAADVTVSSVVVPAGGNKGLLTLVLPGTVTGIDSGMRVSGAGVGTYATTVGAGVTSVVNGVTVTTVTVTDQNYENVTGPVTFSVWPLENPGLITNLTPLLSSTPGWIKHLAGNPSATTWTGGTILLGGDGNDTLYPIAGENVLHGSDYLHTCIKVNTPNFNNAGADVPCGGGLGYSGMTLLNAIMDSGAVNPGDLSIVREILPTSTPVTSYTADGNKVVFTAANNYYVGESISIFGITPAKYNLVNAIVTAADATTFTVASNVTAVSSTSVSGARAVATDTVALPGTVDQYTIVPFMPSGGLPAGTTSAYKIISQDGRQDIIYDVQMVSFAGAPAVAISTSTPALTSLTVTPGTFAPVFSANTLNYTLVVNHLNPTTGAVADVTSVSITPVAAAVGATIQIQNGTGPRLPAVSGQPFTVTGLSTTGPTNINVIVTAADGVTQTTYVIVVSHAGLVPIMQEHTTATTNSVVISVTNYDSHFTFTPTVTTTTPHNPGVPAVAVAAGTANGSTLPITVSNLLPNESATVTVTATRTGFTDATATKTVSATTGGALIATFGNIVSTTDGFTVQMTNYSPLYSLAISTTAGTVSQGTPSGSNLLLTVTGLSTGQSAQITVAATRTGYTDGTSSVIGNATQGVGITPTVDTAAGTSTGFTFNVTNYDPSYTYLATTNHGSVVPGAPSGSNLPFTLTGIALGSSASVTITATKSGSTVATATITGSANPLSSGGTISIVGAPTNSSVGSHISMSVTGGAGTGAVTYSTTTSNCYINGNLLTASSAATCVVVAVQAADSTHASATSSPASFDFAAAGTLAQQSPLSLTGSAGSVTVGSTITLSTTGGSSSGGVYYYTNTPGCLISGSTLSASAAGTCSVMAIKLGDSTYAGVASSLVSFVFSSSNLSAQAPLSVSGNPSTTTVGSTISLSAVGGSGSGAVTFSTNSSGVCSISGNVLTAIAAGACVVIVSKATDGLYAATTGNSTFNITNVIDIGTFAFTNGVFSNVAGTSVTVIAAGGPGTGRVTYTTSPTGCLIRGSILTVTSAPIACTVVATKAASAGSGALTISQSFSFTVRPQAALRISNTAKTGLSHTSRVILTATGGSGTGAIVYQASGTGCNASGATLTATGAGTCHVTATKAASSIYDVATTSADFVFTS